MGRRTSSTPWRRRVLHRIFSLGGKAKPSSHQLRPIKAEPLNDQLYYMRSTELVVVTSRNGVLLVGAGDAFIVHDTAHAFRWSHLMQVLANPVPGKVIQKSTVTWPERDAEMLERLIAKKFVLQDPNVERLAAVRDSILSENRCFHFVSREPVCPHLIVACTGSIVAGLMVPTLLSLCYSSFQRNLDVILTETAQKFVTRDLIESYGIRTWGDAFERRDGIYVPHVQLARSAGCVLVMPASASSLHRLAEGACTDLLSLLVAATHAPVILAPAMNEVMWNNGVVQQNVQTLRQNGMYVIEPTIIFGAADLATGGQPMYGGHGTLWLGPNSLMQTVSRVLRLRNVPSCPELRSVD